MRLLERHEQERDYAFQQLKAKLEQGAAEAAEQKYRFWNLYPYVLVYAWEAKPVQVVSVIHGVRDLAAILALREGID